MSITRTLCRSEPRRRTLPCAALGMVVLMGGAARAQQSEMPLGVPRPPARTAPPAALAFQGATVIDVVTGRRLLNQTIVIVGNRIRTVGPAGRVRTPPGTRVLKADGTFVIPGLWDMHVHVMGFPNTFFPLFLANGITGVRDMATPLPLLDSMLQWRREIAAGQRVGPRIVTAGPSITNSNYATALKGLPQADGKPGPGHMIGADTPDEGRRIVDSLKRRGVDFIKVYDYLARNVYFAILAEARRVGLPVAGHLPDSISAVEASDSGQRSLEHGSGPGLSACLDSTQVSEHKWVRLDFRQCRALAARFRRNETWVQLGPVTVSGRQLPWAREQGRYTPDSLYDLFAPGSPHEQGFFSTSVEEWAAWHREAPKFRWAVKAGIRFLAGSDVAPFGFEAMNRPGFGLHDHLWEYVRQSMTPLQALQSATLNPAKYFHATDSMGTVTPGKVADFVFLDADPLQDIFNTRRIRGVVADGRFYDRADLDSLLIGVERFAKQSRRP